MAPSSLQMLTPVPDLQKRYPGGDRDRDIVAATQTSSPPRPYGSYPEQPFLNKPPIPSPIANPQYTLLKPTPHKPYRNPQPCPENPSHASNPLQPATQTTTNTPPIDDVVQFTPDKPDEPTTSSTTTTATTAREAVENPYITKQDAAEEQSYEAHLLGGRVEKGSLAAQMQVN
ncbi:hypothetical protein FQN52_008967 [Onygenales sp. PD_12]|nr:hypothetical protein FQN52_008967 [Onygenales sp. PD_12]